MQKIELRLTVPNELTLFSELMRATHNVTPDISNMSEYVAICLMHELYLRYIKTFTVFPGLQVSRVKLSFSEAAAFYVLFHEYGNPENENETALVKRLCRDILNNLKRTE